jgi:hypothetical protein
VEDEEYQVRDRDKIINAGRGGRAVERAGMPPPVNHLTGPHPSPADGPNKTPTRPQTRRGNRKQLHRNNHWLLQLQRKTRFRQMAKTPTQQRQLQALDAAPNAEETPAPPNNEPPQLEAQGMPWTTVLHYIQFSTFMIESKSLIRVSRHLIDMNDGDDALP